jgi:DNA-binding FrmR family transcriptional regulator
LDNKVSDVNNNISTIQGKVDAIQKQIEEQNRKKAKCMADERKESTIIGKVYS